MMHHTEQLPASKWSLLAAAMADSPRVLIHDTCHIGDMSAEVSSRRLAGDPRPAPHGPPKFARLCRVHTALRFSPHSRFEQTHHSLGVRAPALANSMHPSAVAASAAAATATSATPLRRFAAAATTTCAAHATAYGQCVLATYTDIRKDACKAEFDKFGACLRQVVRIRVSSPRSFRDACGGLGPLRLHCPPRVCARGARHVRVACCSLARRPGRSRLRTDEAQVVIPPNSARPCVQPKAPKHSRPGTRPAAHHALLGRIHRYHDCRVPHHAGQCKSIAGSKWTATPQSSSGDAGYYAMRFQLQYVVR